MPTIDDLRRYYAQLPDDVLENLALNEAGDLTPEAIAALQAEIRNRGFPVEVANVIDVQLHALGKGEFEDLVQWFRGCECPRCGIKGRALNAFTIAEAMSFLILTKYTTSLLVACPGCISKAAKEALLLSITLGWWGIPWGPIRTLEAISLNLAARKAEDRDAPTEELLNFIRHNIAVVLDQRQQSRAKNGSG